MKTVPLLISAFMGVAFMSCKDTPPAPKPPKVVVTSPILEMVAHELTKGNKNLQVLSVGSTVGHCAHEQNISVEQMKQLCSADLVLRHGGSYDAFVDKALAQCPQQKVQSVVDPCATLTAKEGGKDPHVWMGAAGMQCMVQHSTQALAKWDTQHASEYQKQAQNLLAQNANLWDSLRAQALPLKGSKAVAFHDAYGYLSQEYHLQIVASFGEELEHSQPSAQEIAQLISQIRTQKVQYLFVGLDEMPQLASTVQQETQVLLYPLATQPHNATWAEYADLQKHNLQILLGKESSNSQSIVHTEHHELDK